MSSGRGQEDLKSWAYTERMRPYPGHGANVILMAMGDDDCLDLGAPAVQETGVRKDFLHAQVGEAAQHALKQSGAPFGDECHARACTLWSNAQAICWRPFSWGFFP